MRLVQDLSLEELNKIETELEAFIGEEFFMSVVNEALRYKISVEIQRVLEEEYQIVGLFSFDFVGPNLQPAIYLIKDFPEVQMR